MLSGSSRSSINMTVKWDGAPAIFAGIDPSDGKFFVAKNQYSILIPNYTNQVQRWMQIRCLQKRPCR